MEYPASSPEHPLWPLVPLSAADVPRNLGLSWREIEWAVDKGILGWRSVVDLARLRLDPDESDTAILELAYLTKADASCAGEIVRRLACCEEEPTVVSKPEKKWLFVVLRSLYNRRDQVADPFEMIEIIYGEFDYPEEIAGLVRWMPISTPPMRGETIEDKWCSYLVRAERQLLDGETLA